MNRQTILMVFGKGLLLAVLFGLWAFGYSLLGMGACFDCSVQNGLISSVCAAILLPGLVLYYLGSSRGRLQILRRFRRPSLRLLVLVGSCWGLLMGLVLWWFTGSPVRLAGALLAWLVFFIVFPRLFERLFGQELEITDGDA